jgi:hypothetical protein
MMPFPTSGQRPAPGIAVDRELELARLRARLQRLAARHAAERPPPADPLTLESVPTPHGPALRRVETVRVPAAIVAAAPPSSGTVFLDTETTGLAGGTGTYVFLVGLATWTTARTVTVTQYFLGDLGAEAAFLHAVREAMTAARELVTFNGRTFDLPLLETRYLLARASWWGAELPHQDLYPVARALWRGRAADCRLSTLEDALLGLDRGDDRYGPRRTLPLVARHADVWNCPTYALDALASRRAALDAECTRIGRDPASLRTTEEAVLDSLVANEEMVGFRGHRSPALPRDRVVELLRARGTGARPD